MRACSLKSRVIFTVYSLVKTCSASGKKVIFGSLFGIGSVGTSEEGKQFRLFCLQFALVVGCRDGKCQ